MVDSDNPNENFNGGAQGKDFYNYTGYRIDVVYDLYAKFVVADNWSNAVDKFYKDPEGDNKSTNWMNLTEDTFANDYPNIKVAFYTALGNNAEDPINSSTDFSRTQVFNKYDSFNQVSKSISGLPRAFNISVEENGKTVNKIVFASYALLETQVNLVDVDKGDNIAYREYLTPNFVATTVPDTNGNDHYNFRNISYQTGDKVVAYWFSTSAYYLSSITYPEEGPVQSKYTSTDYRFMKPRFDEKTDVEPETFCKDYKGLTFSYEEHLPYIWIDEQISSANDKDMFINDQFNAIDTTSLKVTKNWGNDNKNIYGTRPDPDNDKYWEVDYQLQQSDGNNVWTDYNLEKKYDTDGNLEKDFYKVITGKDEQDTVYVEYSNLPANGVVRVYGEPDPETKVKPLIGYKYVNEFKYRVLEKDTDDDKTPINDVAGPEVIPDGIYNSTYEVTYDNEYVDDPEDLDDPNNLNDPNYRNVSMTNEMITIDAYAQKTWKDENNVLTSPVWFELQYQAGWKKNADGTLAVDDKGNNIPIWSSFDTPARVLVDGTKDTDTVCKAYYEYDPWEAKWIDVPKVMPGSITTGEGDDKQTNYRVIEADGDDYNWYPSNGQEGRTIKVNGKDVIYYVLNSNVKPFEEIATDQNKGIFFSIQNELTELKLEKSIERLEGATLVNADKKFTFQINGDVPNSAKYQIYTYGVSEPVTTILPLKTDGNINTFDLQDNQYAMIYGLKKGKPYSITESGNDGYALKYTITANGETSNEAYAGNSTITGTIPAKKPAKTPVVSMVNERLGKVTITKTDLDGKAVGGIRFELRYKDTIIDPETHEPTIKELPAEYVDLSTGEVKTFTEEQSTTTYDGKVTFNNLILEREYVLEEVSAPGYHKYPEPIEFQLPYTPKDKDQTEQSSNAFYKIGSGDDQKFYYPEVTMTIKNDKAFIMPQTSGTGFFWPGMIGVAVSVLSAGGYVVTRKKKKREEEENEEVN